jgi:very-short-patch-repair endonuclease
MRDIISELRLIAYMNKANRLADKPLIRDQARLLRRDPSDAEQKLWEKLRRGQLRGAKFRRQFPIGPYIADFACIEAALTIELDGGQHAERAATDNERTRFIERMG